MELDKTNFCHRVRNGYHNNYVGDLKNVLALYGVFVVVVVVAVVAVVAVAEVGWVFYFSYSFSVSGGLRLLADFL